MATQMMPPTARYVTATGNVQIQPGSAIPTATGYVTVPMSVVRDSGVVEAYKSNQSKGLGITLIIIGALAFIFNGVAIASYDPVASIGHGFWCGLLFALTGSFGIAAASKRRCLIVAFMVLTIISAIFAIPMLSFGLTGATYRSCNILYLSYNYRSCNRDLIVAMEALLALLALVAAIAALWGSAICCSAVCCCANTYGTMFAAPYGNQQVMIISQQQQQQPPGAAQYYTPQVMPMNFSPPAYPLGNVPPAQPYLASSTSQQQQYIDQQQPPAYGYASAPNADEVLSSGVGLPIVSSPPAYSEIIYKGPAI